MNIPDCDLPIRRGSDVDCVRIDALPREQQDPFAQWLHRQTRPVISALFPSRPPPRPTP